MAKVMVFGTFDKLHKGHINMLEQAKKLGDYLVVVVARDKTVLEVKGKLPRDKERKRKDVLENEQLADEVILGSETDVLAVVKTKKPNIVALGYDQNSFVNELEKIKDGLKIVRLKPFKPGIYKSSKML